MELEKKIIIDFLSEAKLYESDDVTIKTDHDILIGKGRIGVTSKTVVLRIINNIFQQEDIVLRYQDILFHAVNKTENYILLNIGVDSQSFINNKIYIYSTEGIFI